jgi:hypothetical protein
MLVKILEFGSSWWYKAGHDPDDPYRYTRHGAYYNSTGVRCGVMGQKVQHHWIVPGLVRFNGVGSFNPNFPRRAIGRIFCSDAMAFTLGGNRLLIKEKMRPPRTPDCYLVVIASDSFGDINFADKRWRSHGTSLVCASQLRDQQEAMLLMHAADWVRTSAGTWQLEISDALPNGVGLRLVRNEL